MAASAVCHAVDCIVTWAGYPIAKALCYTTPGCKQRSVYPAATALPEGIP